MSNKHNVRRVNKKLVSKGNTLGVEIFQNDADNLLYYKDINGVLVPLMTNESTEITSLQSSVATIEAGTSLYAEVTMSAAQINTADSSGSGAFQILSAPAAGSYYLIHSMSFEYTHVTTNYIGAGVNDGFEIRNKGMAIGFLAESLFTGGENRVAVITSGTVNSSIVAHTQGPFPLNGAIDMLHTDANGMSTGDGTLLIKLRYQEIVFGTEL